jgi:hypothetical protein
LSVPEVVGDMRSALVDFPHALHSVVSSSCFFSIISERFSGLTLIFTDGSRSGEGTSFGIYVPGQQSFEYLVQEPSGVFTAEITALLTGLHFVGSGQPGEFLILTDSLRISGFLGGFHQGLILSSTSAVLWCSCWYGNEMVDRIAKESAVSGNLYWGGALECDLCPQMKSCLLMDWQSTWDGGDMDRYAFSKFLRVRLSPWFLDVLADRPMITLIFCLISNHTRVRAHLSRINIVAEALCGCECDYETVDHILLRCHLYRHERIQLWSQLSTSNRSICVRDMLAHRQWCDIRVCVAFLSSMNFHV